MSCQVMFHADSLYKQVAGRWSTVQLLQKSSLRTGRQHAVFSRTKVLSASSFQPQIPNLNHKLRSQNNLEYFPNVVFKSQNHPFKNLNRMLQTTCARSSLKEVVHFELSDIGEGIGEVTIKEWFVGVGTSVKQFDPICEVQSDKASVTITSRFDGNVKKLYYDVDDTARVGLPLVDIEIESQTGHIVDEGDFGNTNESQSHHPTEIIHTSPNLNSYKKTLATPAVRRMAQEFNVNMSSITGSGKDGRVLKEDILNHIGSGSNERLSLSQHMSATQTITDEGKSVASKNMTVVEREPIVGIRKSMFKTMTSSNNIPQFQLSDDVDMTKFVSLKPFLKEISSAKGVAIRPLSFLIKSTSMALKSFRILNSSVDNENIIYKKHHNIGFAMDTPHGLVVPNIKSVQNLTVIEIAEELRRLQVAGAKGKLSMDDLKDGTITISNIGSIGGTFGIPMILPPEVAIGATGKIRLEPKIDMQGNVSGKHIMTVVWSADHRVIDGATITRFNNLWKSYVEQPESMLIELK